MKRRDFLTRSAAVGAAIPLGVAAPAILTSCSDNNRTRRRRYTPEELGMWSFAETAPDGRPLRAALIGCGHRGTGAAVDFLHAGNDLEIVALADVLPDRIERSRAILAERGNQVADENCFIGFDGYQRAVVLPEVDVVLITTPNHFKPEQFRAAVEANKHVFMEKCPCIDPVGTRAIIAASRMATARGLTVLTGNQYRHRRDHWAAYIEMKNGLIGDIVGASCHYDVGAFWEVRKRPEWSDMEYQMRNWFNVRWISGDHILDQGVHSIDVVTWFLDEELPVRGVGYGGRARRRTGDTFDFFSIDYRYTNGKRVLQTARQIDGTARDVSEQIFGTKGIVELSPRTGGQRIVDWDGNVLWEYDLEANPVPSPYRQTHIHLVESIRQNKRINTAETLAMSNQVAILGRETCYTGRAITWEEIMASDLRYGPTPDEYAMGPIAPEHFQEGVAPIPGTEAASPLR